MNTAIGRPICNRQTQTLVLANKAGSNVSGPVSGDLQSVARANHVPELDSLRGALAMWVVLGHALEINGHTPPPLLDPIHAVDVFVILSGFVICLLRLDRGEPYGLFIARRFLRLWPAFALITTIAVVLAYSGAMPKRFTEAQLPILIPAHLAMLHGAIPQGWANWAAPGYINKDWWAAGAFLNPSWSISLEWQFYLVAPLFVWALARWPWAILSTLAVIALQRAHGHLGFGYAFLTSKIALFWVGMVSAIVYRRLTTNAALIAFSGMLGMALLFTSITAMLGLIIWLAAMSVILAGRIGRLPTTFLSSSAPLGLGAISYSLYLAHEPIIYLVVRLLGPHRPWPVATTILLALPLSIGAAWVIHRLVEAPAIAFGKRLGGQAHAKPGLAQPDAAV